jgi:hypothetical protein
MWSMSWLSSHAASPEYTAQIIQPKFKTYHLVSASTDLCVLFSFREIQNDCWIL